MKYKINKEAALRFTILVMLAVLLSIALISGNIQKYVHPRLNMFLWFSVIIILCISFFMLPELKKPGNSPGLSKYLIILLPLCAAVLIPVGIIQNKSVNLNAAVPSLTSSSKGTAKTAAVGSSSGASGNALTYPLPKAKHSYSDHATITDDEFADWYMEINQNMQAYEGKTFRFKGQVFRAKSFATNEFSPVRYAMVCCVADLQPCGLLCRSDQATGLKDKDWVWITGKIKIEKYQGELTPVCYVTKIEKAEPAKDDYIYFAY